jgi:hypothetical protein
MLTQPPARSRQVAQHLVTSLRVNPVVGCPPCSGAGRQVRSNQPPYPLERDVRSRPVAAVSITQDGRALWGRLSEGLRRWSDLSGLARSTLRNSGEIK